MTKLFPGQGLSSVSFFFLVQGLTRKVDATKATRLLLKAAGHAYTTRRVSGNRGVKSTSQQQQSTFITNEFSAGLFHLKLICKSHSLLLSKVEDKVGGTLPRIAAT
uniref:Uncharacterized protein n=1 Tax=Glossina austeni TaxID=7395 RepID=A0A1A9UI73_GLOAU